MHTVGIKDAYKEAHMREENRKWVPGIKDANKEAHMKDEIRKWVSYRAQTLSRTGLETSKISFIFLLALTI